MAKTRQVSPGCLETALPWEMHPWDRLARIVARVRCLVAWACPVWACPVWACPVWACPGRHQLGWELSPLLAPHRRRWELKSRLAYRVRRSAVLLLLRPRLAHRPWRVRHQRRWQRRGRTERRQVRPSPSCSDKAELQMLEVLRLVPTASPQPMLLLLLLLPLLLVVLLPLR